MTQWQYEFFSLNKEYEGSSEDALITMRNWLNDLGKNGWEPVDGFSYSTDKYATWDTVEIKELYINGWFKKPIESGPYR